MKNRPGKLLIIVFIMLIFGLSSYFMGLNFFPWTSWVQWYYRLAQILILVSSFVYIISSIFIFSLKKIAKKLSVIYSMVLLLYFSPLSIFLIFDPTGWGAAMVFSFLPYILFPLFFIIFLTRPKVKELFKK